jgi:sphingomyelin phosphodiesterase
MGNFLVPLAHINLNCCHFLQLIQWLQYAEDHQEKVHIIGHHPPRMCMVSFSWSYHSIINRYQNTIAAQFFAHTHNDEFMLFYDEADSKRPVSIFEHFIRKK